MLMVELVFGDLQAAGRMTMVGNRMGMPGGIGTAGCADFFAWFYSLKKISFQIGNGEAIDIIAFEYSRQIRIYIFLQNSLCRHTLAIL